MRMKRIINRRLLAISSVAMISTLILAVSVFYEMFQKEVLEDLRNYADVLRSTGYFDEGKQNTANLEFDNLRVTIITKTGEVKFDNTVNLQGMSNHGDRPEVEEALEKGEGKDIRHSSTLNKSAFYYAVRLEDGSVLRIAKEANSIWSVFEAAMPTIISMLIVLWLICMGLAKLLTKSIITPIEDMAKNMEHFDSNNIYKELLPFVNTIRDQHQDILRNANMRQEFTANVSHELKTPLTAISGYAELIRSGMAKGEDAQKFAKEIHHNANRLLTLINDIIRLSELDGSECKDAFEEVDLYELAEECINTLQVNAKEQKIALQLHGQKSLLHANKSMMEEVLYNLCSNAIRYNNEGGKVDVTVEQKDAHTLLTVKDNGIGISKEHQERIFERFYRVDKSRSKSTGGTGLGLAIVKHIVALHEAELHLKSEVGEGTEITIIFS